MTTKASFIWDLDGTLFDSYPAIVPSAREICAEAGANYEESYVRDFVLRTSVNDLLRRVAEEKDLAFEPLKAAFTARSDSRWASIQAIPHARETLAALRAAGCRSFVYTHRGASIQAIPHARETLAALRAAGCRSFVYTHRGASSFAILENTGLAPYLDEVLTSESGFPRKPDPAAILYLLDKYALDPAETYYVGDRRLDMEAAHMAGIGGILFREPGNPTQPLGSERFVIADLREILQLFSL